MASGCVPAATDLPGLRDVAGLSGHVVPSGDADALRDELLALANDDERWSKQSAASIAAAAAFSWEHTVDEYERLLER